MNQFRNETVLITGVSKGIGASLVPEFVNLGAKVIGIARSSDALAELESKYPEQFTGISIDLSDIDSWKKLVEKVKQVPHTLILNAGTCEYIDNGNVDSKLVKRVFDINFMANVYAAEILLPAWSDKLKQWAVVSSSARYFAMPRAEAYGSSKAALSYFFESLQLNFPGIRFSQVHPGFVETPLTDKNDFSMPFKITSEKAASTITKGLLKKKRQINFPLFFTLFLRLLGVVPASLRYKLGRGMLKQ
ncbi:MAG: SDR family NAD(P)-dependent oxidoreductase [Gammaproteobacteria bacterium]|nr:SDR family NAD(P)-dependent oxidoreductase [Gammaproteobacteria bacterium]